MTDIEYCITALVAIGGILAEIFRPALFQITGEYFKITRYTKFHGYAITYCFLLILLLSVVFIPKGFWLTIACGVCFFVIGAETFSIRDYVGNIAVSLTAISMIIYHIGCWLTNVTPHTTLVLFTTGVMSLIAEILVRSIG